MDTLSKERRSWNMSRIKSKDTAPELYIRSLLHHAGYRFRLHTPRLPGKPDIVLPKYKTIIEVRGCFWHLHANCPEARIPQTKSDWWKEKLHKNVQRDIEHVAEWTALGWKVLIIWECILLRCKKNESVQQHVFTSIESFLKTPQLFQEIPSPDSSEICHDK